MRSAPKARGSAPSRPAELLEPSRSKASNIAPPGSREVSSIAQFVARYPTSPLADSAVVHRLLLLRSIDPMAAQTAAHDYLSRYPGGYAKNDAENLLWQP